MFKDCNWNRYWYLREIDLNWVDGYLFPPHGEYNLNQNLKTFEEITDIPCLILLGEQGIGKSYFFEKLKQQENSYSIFIQLKEYSSEDRLVKDLMENPKVLAAKKTDSKLFIFIDSLDEALSNIKSMPALLIKFVEKNRSDKFFLRIFCRSSQWHSSLEEKLEELYPKKLKVYEMAPLLKSDIEAAAKNNNIASEQFMNAIKDKKLSTFAMKPITLEFLLNEYAKIKCLPDNRSELYKKGCLQLCQPTKERETKYTSTFIPEEFMETAAFISVVMKFNNNSFIFNKVDRGDKPDGVIQITDLRCGKIILNDKEIQITQQLFKETLDTGLFIAKGNGLMGWSHKSYEDFLSAYYLAKNQIPLPQIMNLILLNLDSDKFVIPQLRDMVVWLAEIRNDVFEALININPDLLIEVDFKNISDTNKKKLIEEYLNSSEKEKYINNYYRHWEYYPNLNHNGIIETLNPYINDNGKNSLTRELAIEIAKKCNIGDLQNSVIKIVLDSSQDINIREAAARFISDLGNEENKKQLKNIINDPDDKDDNLKGIALESLWPDYLNTEELFDNLTSEKDINYWSSYYTFLEDFHKKLTPKDLPFALKWVIKFKDDPKCEFLYQINHHEFKNIFKNILQKSFDCLKDEILEIFCNTIVLFINDYDFVDFLLNDYKKTIMIFKKINSINKKTFYFAFKATIIDIYRKRNQDNEFLNYLIEELKKESDINNQEMIAALIENLFWYSKDEHKILIFDEITKLDNVLILKDTFKEILAPVKINDSEEIEDKKFDHEKIEAKKKLENKIENLLKRIESEEIIYFRELIELLFCNSSGFNPGNLNDFEKWNNLRNELKQRVIESAKIYLEKTDKIGCIEGWFIVETIFLNDEAYINSIPDNIWKKCIPMIIKHGDLRENRLILTKKVYEKLPDKFLEIFKDILITIPQTISHLKNYMDWTYCYISRLKYFWNDNIKNFILGIAKDESLDYKLRISLLNSLLEKCLDESTILYLHYLFNNNRNDKDLRVSAGALLLRYDNNFHSLFNTLKKDNGLSREIISKITDITDIYDTNLDKLHEKLNKAELKDLYIFLYKLFEDDTRPQGDKTTIYLYSIINKLVNIGAYKEIKEIINTIKLTGKDRDNLEYRLIETKNNYLVNYFTENHPTANQIIEILNDNKKRYIENEDQLLDVLMDCLKSLEDKLQRTSPPAAIDLWNENKNKYKPKDENRFSDYVKRYLDDSIKAKKIIVNREVEIKRGSETDIKIDTFNAKNEHIAIIIESKGCWHKELDTSMEDQLIKKYLMTSANFSHGIYLIACFLCDKWDNGDYRKNDTKIKTIEAIKSKFAIQAQELSKKYNKTVKSFVIDTGYHECYKEIK